MTAAPTLAAVAAIVAGAACLYLGMPRQQALARPWPAWPSRAAALVLLGVGWSLWSAVLHPATAFFAGLTVAMVTLLAVPVLAALVIQGRRA